jgi:hypothetical protein
MMEIWESDKYQLGCVWLWLMDWVLGCVWLWFQTFSVFGGGGVVVVMVVVVVCFPDLQIYFNFLLFDKKMDLRLDR